MVKKRKAQSKSETSKIQEISDVYVVPYEMARDLYLEGLSDKDLPANERVSEDVAKRLSVSVGEVTVRPFDDDECIYIGLKIRGSEEDIDKVNKVLQARDKSVEQEDEETQ